MTRHHSAGFTLMELIVSLALFSIVMLLASGAYLIMIGIDRQAQAVATGVDNLTFALESMARTIRTSTHYQCGSVSAVDACVASGNSRIRMVLPDGTDASYSLSVVSGMGQINQTTLTSNIALSDQSLINVTSLTFYVSGIDSTDALQPYVTIVAQGKVSSGPGTFESVSVETSAIMRGTDI